MMNNAHPRYHRGITLLEMIVVLLIASMALTLGYQSLSQWQRAQASISGISRNIGQDRLTEAWLGSSLRGLSPLQDAPFEGTPARLSGITTRPVIAGQGGTTDISWSIESSAEGVELLLDEGGQEFRLPLPGVTSARFIYLDGAGEESDSWPRPLGVSDHLPRSVMLVQELAGSPRTRVWGATVAGRVNPSDLPGIYEPEYD